MRPLKLRRDPAPSRSAYRLQRLWLTPGVRLFLRWGVPALAVVASLLLWGSDPDRRARLADGVAEIRSQIEQRPEFMVKLMTIVGASPDVADELRIVLPFDFPVTSFDLDLDMIRRTAERIDAIRKADVRIRSGGVLEIEVTERVPAVVWRGEEGLELLDRDGHRVATVTARRARADLPLVAGAGAGRAVPEALELFAAAAPIAPRVRGLLRVGERRWDLVLDRDQRIRLPEDDPRTALERVIALDEVRDLLSRDVTVIDMRNPDRPTIRMGDGAAERFRETSLPGDHRL